MIGKDRLPTRNFRGELLNFGGVSTSSLSIGGVLPFFSGVIVWDVFVFASHKGIINIFPDNVVVPIQRMAIWLYKLRDLFFEIISPSQQWRFLNCTWNPVLKHHVK